MKFIFTSIIVLFLESSVGAQVCSLFDNNFGSLGRAFGYTGATVYYTLAPANLLLQDDGKIIQVASEYHGNSSEMIIVRYQPGGQPDSSFGAGGISKTKINDFSTSAGKGILQADGKLLVVAIFTGSSFAKIGVVRFKTNGRPDSSFGINGIVLPDLGSSNEYAQSIAIQPDGKFIVVGNNGDNASLIARFLPDGRLDAGFGQNGKIITHTGHLIGYIGNVYYGMYGYENATGVAVQPDGKITVACNSYSSVGCYDYYGSAYCSPSLALLRYTENGIPDSSFGKNGMVRDSLYMQSVNDIALQADGKILVTGNGGGNAVTERYLSTGLPDNGFGQGGKVFTSSINASYSYSNNIMLKPDGKILISGGAVNYNNQNLSELFVAQFRTDGALDSNFNVTGIYTFRFTPSGSGVESRGLGFRNGKIFVGGKSEPLTTQSLAVARLLENPSRFPIEIIASGPLSFCQGQSVQLMAKTSGITGSVQWYQYNSALQYATDTIYNVNIPGNYSVVINNNSGCGIAGPVTVSILPITGKPAIDWNGTSLVAPSGFAKYVWTRNGSVINGAESNTYNPLQPGLYRVAITNIQGCSDTSNNFNLLVLGISDVQLGDVKIRYYPNPARDFLNINVSGIPSGKQQADLYDFNGRLVQQLRLSRNHNELPLQQLPGGYYQLVLYDNTQRITVKVLVAR